MNTKYLLFAILFFIHTINSFAFVKNIQRILHTSVEMTSNNFNERTIYFNYLIGLRKTRNYIRRSSSIDCLKNNLNNNNTIGDTSELQIYNNSEVGVKQILMGNVVLDVSRVKYIHIYTNSENITLELDKNVQKQDSSSLFDKMKNLEAIINTISILNQILNNK